MEAVLLYILPMLPRFLLSWPGSSGADWLRVTLSIVPLLVVAPSMRLPAWVQDERAEHVWRHAAYALAFTVSAVAAVRWDVIAPALRDGTGWAVALLLYLVIGTATLWWFCLSHVLENRGWNLATHQGDVAVLPLTLVAIATFHESVPDAAFQFSRSVIFYVPVIVSWATLHFLAYNGFAENCTTTHSTPAFHFLALSGLVIATAHLALLEVRAPPALFQILPVVAALACQCTHRTAEAPRPRPRRTLGILAVGGGLTAAIGAAVWPARVDLVVTPAVVLSCYACALPVLIGHRWVPSGVLYTTLVSAAVGHSVAPLAPSDVAALLLVSAAGCVAVRLLVVSTWRPDPPSDPPRGEDAAPQRDVSWWSPSALLGGALSAPLPGCATRAMPCYGDAILGRMCAHVDPSCPEDFRGVWWMCGNTFPMELIALHGLRWTTLPEPSAADDAAAGDAPRRAPRRVGGRVEASFCMRSHIARDATVGGLILHALAFLSHIHIRHAEGRWIRTDGWCFGPLRLLYSTYWLYRVGEDEFLRVCYDRRGVVVWQYRMLRIARDARTRTRFYHQFMEAKAGGRAILA